ncbi:DUF4157 domain-containing protein [Enterovibrio sp. ZSDZ35]|uniref:DUF4157 domain-containing protein n=1 Tax=Enterovibrio qingdaonensis TaxID=2899818 RepID=A0ABT5QUZ4_9GAMM|nr:DUF4157 domain-containing protein [Enterovibrio sp. ZSDZ35]MDD1784111.1 DUF4157 domain-containing protein [Enterovibrio sp. ZSDZ35]
MFAFQSDRFSQTRNPSEPDASLLIKPRHAPLRHHSFLQRKLMLGAPDSALEQDADRQADNVMAMPKGLGTPRCSCSASRPSSSSNNVQRKPTQSSHHTDGEPAPESVERVVNTPGQPIPDETRTFMEERFGQDFGHVRIHRGVEAASSARDIQAKAYTVANNIVFGENQYSNSTQGRRLLAHELGHVIQQQRGTPLVQRVTDEQLWAQHEQREQVETGPMTVTAVDDRQDTSMPWYFPPRYAGPITGALRGDVPMTNVTSLVDNVIAHVGEREIQRLNIADHGNPDGMEFGNDWLTTNTVSSFTGELSRLRPHFTSNAIVHIEGCKSGQNQTLVCALAAAFGVPVYAGTGFQHGIFRFNTGDYVRCSPAGEYEVGVGRP